ncbi:MAG: 6-bladed beta-propeller [bacterium]|nr:6-bladed beta-propeller [bacterium]
MSIKRTIIIFCAVFLSVGLFSTLEADSFTKIRTIGTGEDGGFMLYSAHSVAVDASKNIYVLDGKGHRLVKFNWQGKFLKQFGQEGRGPKDLLSPRDVSIHDNILCIHDSKNQRIVVTDTELNYIEEIQWDMKLGFPPTIITCLESNTFLGKYSFFEKDKKRFTLLDGKLNKKNKEFFSYHPEKIDLQADYVNYMLAVTPIVGISHRHKRILITLVIAENAMRFFLYDFEGNPKGEFQYQQETKYKLPLGFLNSRKKFNLIKEKFTYSALTGIYPYRGDFLVFVGQVEKVRFLGDDRIFKIHCLVFSHTGKFKKRMPCYDNIQILNVTPEGYVLASRHGDEEVNVTIFKMEI